jgi:putative DNA modification/repair radical SAM protein
MNSISIQEKIKLLANGAKYDVSCSSSGSKRSSEVGMLGNTVAPGICHSWSEDGRCISLLKILMSNDCVYDCAYCVNRKSESIERATLSPEELVRLTIEFYRRNYIEGLFLSSAVISTPDETMLRMIRVVKLLRKEGFNGYIHLKGIPGADVKLVEEAGMLVDRMSINLEIPTERRLQLLAPQKNYNAILTPMNYMAQRIAQEKKHALRTYKQSTFIPAGQTSQMMVGLGNDSDFRLMQQATHMYKYFNMKRVYYSAYMPLVQNNPLLPTIVHSPLLREHRLYQADWLMRFYGFEINELLSEALPNFDLALDPKAFWALNHMEIFPVEVTKAPLDMLLRVPGIGPLSARRIVASRKQSALTLEGLKRIGIVLKRAQYFITLNGKSVSAIPFDTQAIRPRLVGLEKDSFGGIMGQMSLMDQHAHLFDSTSLLIGGPS